VQLELKGTRGLLVLLGPVRLDRRDLKVNRERREQQVLELQVLPVLKEPKAPRGLLALRVDREPLGRQEWERLGRRGRKVTKGRPARLGLELQGPQGPPGRKEPRAIKGRRVLVRLGLLGLKVDKGLQELPVRKESKGSQGILEELA